jgi:CheY-like chemotaxis protein
MTKVLIIDDDPLILNVYSKVLSQKNFSPLTAENGKIGLDILTEDTEISKVLLDVYMPEMDAYGFLKAVQGDAVLCERYLEIYIVTSGEKEEILQCFFEEKIDMKYIRNILKKPVDLQMLTAALQL